MKLPVRYHDRMDVQSKVLSDPTGLKRAKKLASEWQATIDLDNEHLAEINKYLVRDP